MRKVKIVLLAVGISVFLMGAASSFSATPLFSAANLSVGCLTPHQACRYLIVFDSQKVNICNQCCSHESTSCSGYIPYVGPYYACCK